ncbi:MAG: Kdo hydroxylase family protein [Acidobacteriaceae bacterium]|nr:Kdo hydroxylase family protein [Acidobacteriaceae bacterium]
MKFVSVDAWPSEARVDYRPELEAGNVLFFPTTPFVFSEESQSFLRGLDFAGGAIHKNIAYRPASDRVTGTEANDSQAERLRGIMRDYSRVVVAFASRLLPEYAAHWKLDYASFRPLEEEGRDLPLNKRNDLIHTDAFPSRPTNGDLILRIFTNVHPSKTRNWVVTDPFLVLAEKYARAAGLDEIAAASASAGGKLWNQSARLLKTMGLPVVPRSGYDRFMLRFHEYLKRNTDFQEHCAKYRFNFPPGSTWLTFTDVVPHSVLSGQHALEQTFIIAHRSLATPENAPISVLERLCGKLLVERNRQQQRVA